MELPRPALAKLGGIWPHAADWLSARRQQDRAEALAALRALPDTALFEALVARNNLLETGAAQSAPDIVQILTIRIQLALNNDSRALDIVDALIGALKQGDAPLKFETSVALSHATDGADEGETEGEDTEAESPAQEPPISDPFVTRIEAWLRPFREVGRAGTVEQRLRDLLRGHRDDGPVSVPAWRLAFELTHDAAERTALLAALEHAWIRGDWSPRELGPLVEALAAEAKDAAPRWLARWPQQFDHASTERRAKVLVALGDKPAAARLIAAARGRELWSAEAEVQAFDAWRRLLDSAAPESPPTWATALPFWKKKPDEAAALLSAELRSHAYDVLAARAALRAVSAAPEEPLRRAALTLDDAGLGSVLDVDKDAALLRLRIGRGLLASSPRAASLAVAGDDPNALAGDLVRRHFPNVDVDAALSDVARIAALVGDLSRAERVVSVLDERKSPEVKRVRAELRDLAGPQQPAAAFRVVDGAPAPYRPRDLSWGVLTSALATEVKR
jgi:hypothetical protein